MLFERENTHKHTELGENDMAFPHCMFVYTHQKYIDGTKKGERKRETQDMHEFVWERVREW